MGRLPRAIHDGLIHQNQNFPESTLPRCWRARPCPPASPRLKVIDAEAPERPRTFDLPTAGPHSARDGSGETDSVHPPQTSSGPNGNDEKTIWHDHQHNALMHAL